MEIYRPFLLSVSVLDRRLFHCFISFSFPVYIFIFRLFVLIEFCACLIEVYEYLCCGRVSMPGWPGFHAWKAGEAGVRGAAAKATATTGADYSYFSISMDQPQQQ